MSAIGDYVHYTAKGYNQYGIAHKGENPSFMNYADHKAKTLAKLHQSKLDDKKGLEDAITSILSPQDDSGSPGAQIQSAVQAMLEEKFGAALGRINWETGNITKGTTNGSGGTIAAIKDGAGQMSIELSTILKRVQAIEQMRDMIPNSQTKEELNDRVKQIYSELNQILTQKKTGIIGQLRAIVGAGVSYDVDGVTISNQMINLGSAASVITLINQTLKEYAATPPINLEKGDLFEEVIYLAPAVARLSAGERMQDILGSLGGGVVGGARTKVEINLKEFTGDLDYGALNFKGSAVSETHQAAVSFGASQDKVDVNLEWNGNVIPISAKNVNLSSSFGVHILSGSSLLYLIQDEGNDFVTHYMNIIASHPDGGVTAGLQAAHEAAKLALLYKALTGDTYGKESVAEIFLVNDNSRPGGVYIYEMQDLIQKASENLDMYVKINPELSSISLANRWYDEGYSGRITDLVNQMHQIKISVALQPSLLTS